MGKGVNIPLNIQGLREAREGLKKLDEQLEGVDKRTKEGKALTKQFNELSKAVNKTETDLKAMNAAGQLAGTKFDDLNEVLFNTQEEVLPLTSQIGEMEDRMYQLAQANQQGSKEFKVLQEKVVAARKTIIETDRSIDAMAENAGSLGGLTTAFGELGESVLNLDFKRAGNAVKGLGVQFKAFGKVLLANPIFLIVAIVAAIVTAIVTLKDKVKILGVVFDAVGEAIGWVVQALKNFLDLIGLTDFAEQEMHENNIKRSEEKLARYDRESAAEQANFDRKIALAQAEGKATTDLEKQKQYAIIETNKLRAQELKQIAIQKELLGEFNEEAKEEFKKNYTEILQSTKNAQNQIKIIDANATKEYKEELQKRKEAHETYLQDRLTAERLIQDLELQLMEEGREKMLLQNQITYERLREDTLANETLTREEQLEINKLYDELEAQSKLDILVNNLDQELEIKNEHEAKLEALSVRRTEFEKAQSVERVRLNKEEKEAVADLAVKGLQLVAGITELFADKNEKAAKVAFNVQKVASIAQAVMDGYRAVLSTYAQTPGGPIIKGAAAAVAGGFAALQIANIAKTKFEGGGSGAAVAASVPSASIGGGGATSSAPSTPSFELFGQPNEGNNVSSPEAQETQMTVKAVVVESDITNTQNKVAKMQKNAEL